MYTTLKTAYICTAGACPFGKLQASLFALLLWYMHKVFCVVAKRGLAFFSVCDLVLRTLFILGGNVLKKVLVLLSAAALVLLSACNEESAASSAITASESASSQITQTESSETESVNTESDFESSSFASSILEPSSQPESLSSQTSKPKESSSSTKSEAETVTSSQATKPSSSPSASTSSQPAESQSPSISEKDALACIDVCLVSDVTNAENDKWNFIADYIIFESSTAKYAIKDIEIISVFVDGDGSGDSCEIKKASPQKARSISEMLWDPEVDTSYESMLAQNKWSKELSAIRISSPYMSQDNDRTNLTLAMTVTFDNNIKVNVTYVAAQGMGEGGPLWSCLSDSDFAS